MFHVGFYLSPFTKEELSKFETDFGIENLKILVDLYDKQYVANKNHLFFEICVQQKNYGVHVHTTCARNLLLTWVPYVSDEVDFIFVFPTKANELFNLFKSKLN